MARDMNTSWPRDQLEADYRRDAHAMTSGENLDRRKDLDIHNLRLETRRSIRDALIYIMLTAFDAGIALLLIKVLITAGTPPQDAVRYVVLGLAGSLGGYALRRVAASRRRRTTSDDGPGQKESRS